ncbi:hypothetical protein Droror1_Dr00017429 [Drosera rotundifolia]
MVAVLVAGVVVAVTGVTLLYLAGNDTFPGVRCGGSGVTGTMSESHTSVFHRGKAARGIESADGWAGRGGESGARRGQFREQFRGRRHRRQRAAWGRRRQRVSWERRRRQRSE